MPSLISSTPPPGGSHSLDVSAATPSTVIDATSRLRLDDSLDSSVPYSPGCGLDDSSFNGTGALADSSAMSASPRGGGDGGRSSLSSPCSSLASGKGGGRSSGHSGTGGISTSTAFEKPVSTKVFYHLDDEVTPYMTQVDVPPEHVTLEDFKKVLTRTNFKFYCKTVDPECGVEVKKELLEDHKHLERSANGNFELYLITIEGSTHSEGSSQQGTRASGGGGGGGRHHMVPGPAPSYNNMYARGAGGGGGGGNGHYFDSTMSTESDSMISDGRPPFLPGRNQLQASTRYGNRGGPPPVRHNHHYDFNGHRGRGAGGGRYDDSTLGSESDARVFSDEDDRGSMSTDLTSVSRQHEKMMARRRRAQRTYRRPSRASSFSSITESSMSLHVETVTLNMDTVNFLGISIVGQSSVRGDNGIYVANVMKGGAVALDGRIEPGDMILQVNEVAFDNFTNDQAVDVLREAVERKGTIRLTVAKSIDSNQRSCFTVPRHQPAAYNTRDEPVRPIDTGAWILHTNAVNRGGMPSILEGSEGAPTPLPGERLHHHQLQQQRPATSSSATSTGSNGQNTVVGGSGGAPGSIPRLDIHADKRKVVEVMTRPGSGLDIKNRTWLKISIPMSFLGSDLVEWLLEHVNGLRERKEARKYAAELLRQRLIAHVVNKITFTEQCYYVLGEQCADFARYRTVQVEDGAAPSWQWGAGGAGAKPPVGLPPGIGGSMVSGYASMPMSPMPHALFGAPQAPGPRHFGGEGSQISSTDGSGSSEHKRTTRQVVLPPAPTAAAAAGSSARLDEIPHDVAASRQSFRIAMNNPYEFFVDNL